MQFLVVFKARPGNDPEKFQSTLRPETAVAWSMVKEDRLRGMWYVNNLEAEGPGRAGSVLLLECANEAELRKEVSRFPLVQHDLVSVEILPLVPFGSYELLFADSH